MGDKTDSEQDAPRESRDVHTTYSEQPIEGCPEAGQPTGTDVAKMSPQQQLNYGLNLLMLFAQGYYKILELSISIAPRGRTLDMELNHAYIVTVNNITNLLANHPDLKDFPGGFTPCLPDLYPETIKDLDWDGMMAPYAEEFLSRAQKYVLEKGISEPQEREPDWILTTIFREHVKDAIDVATEYNRRCSKLFRELLEANATASPTTPSDPGTTPPEESKQELETRSNVALPLIEALRTFFPKHPGKGFSKKELIVALQSEGLITKDYYASDVSAAVMHLKDIDQMPLTSNPYRYEDD